MQPRLAIRELTERLRPAPAVDLSPEDDIEPVTAVDEAADLGAAPTPSQTTADVSNSSPPTAVPGTPVARLFEGPSTPLPASSGLLDRPVVQRAIKSSEVNLSRLIYVRTLRPSCALRSSGRLWSVA